MYPITIQENLYIFADFMGFIAIMEAINHLADTNIYRNKKCQTIYINCSDRNSDFIELSKSCKGGNPCLDRIPAIRVMIIKQSMRIFRQFIYTDYLTRLCPLMVAYHLAFFPCCPYWLKKAT